MNVTVSTANGIVSVENYRADKDAGKLERIEELKKVLKVASNVIKDTAPPAVYPRKEGPVTIIAPGVAISSDESAITYNGRIYMLPHEHTESETTKPSVGFSANA